MKDLELDHLVVGAATLEQGVAWCESTLGVTPGPGGRHAFMGTHNRLLRLESEPPGRWRRGYLEIIAIDPLAPARRRRRWFDLDDTTVQAAVAQAPRLLHWVARCADIDRRREAWAALGFDPGAVEAAERASPLGTLRWRITIRADGRRPAGGAVPALIAWQGDEHPADRIDAATVVTLRELALSLPDDWSGPRIDAPGIGLCRGAPPRLRVELEGRRGPVRLESLGDAPATDGR